MMMNKFCRVLIMLCLFALVLSMVAAPILAQPPPHPDFSTSKNHQVFIPGEIVVKVRPNRRLEETETLNKAYGANVLEGEITFGFYRLKVSEPVEKALTAYLSHPAIEYAQLNYILAEVAGEFITLADLQDRIQRMVTPLRQQYMQPMFKENLLRSMVNDKLFLKAAKAEGLPMLPEVQRIIDKAIEKTLIRLYRKEFEAVVVSEKEMLDYYNENIAKYETPEQVRGRLILVETKQEAEEILESLKAGAGFAELARKRSKDKTANRGGDFGWLGRGKMVPVLEQTAFALNRGEISGIIPTQSGYYIVKVENRKDSRQTPFSISKNNIKQVLRAKKQGEQIEAKVKALEEKYKVTLHSKFLSEIRVDPAKGGGPEDIMRIIKEALERAY